MSDLSEDQPCHPGQKWDEWLSVDVDDLTDLILVAPSRRHLLHLEDNHVFTEIQNRLWGCRWAKLSIVGDKPGVKSLVWHSMVSLLENTLHTHCLNYEYITEQMLYKPNSCSIHSPYKIPMKNKKDIQASNRTLKDTEGVSCNFPCKIGMDSRFSVVDPLRTSKSTKCTPFAFLASKCNFIDPPLKIPKRCCPNPESFSKGSTLQGIPLLQKYPLVHSDERIAVASFNIFDVQLDMRLCEECKNIY